MFSVVCEALERLLQQRFINEKRVKFPESISTFAVDADEELTDTLLIQSEAVYCLYSNYLEQVRHGELGKTAQYWLIYLDLMRMQHVIHTAIQENNFQAKLYAWEYFIPSYFVLKKTNYARYGNFYLETLKTIESNYPRMKEMMKHVGLFVHGQDKYPLRASIDQRGEQTINRDAKTTGGIKAFTTQEDSVLKWCLNRSEQARNTRELQNLCGLCTDPGNLQALPSIANH